MKKLPKTWLPYIVAATGFILSFALWYARHTAAYYGILTKYDPWLDFTLSLSISLLIAALAWMYYILKQRALAIQEINLALTKEIKQRTVSEESKQKMETALLQGQKLQAVGTLAGGIAHDFNNILYAIIGYVQLARSDIANDTLVYQNLSKVLEGAQRGQELISRILAFSRRQHHEYTPMNLDQTIKSALSLLTATIPASVIINYHADCEPTVLGNQNQIHQIIINMINNAVDAMDGEGTIDIHVSPFTSDDDALPLFPDILQQEYCKLIIKDTGHGIGAGAMARIFEPFFTTKEVGKGTGLGLSIVHSIIKEHAGRIAVRSEIGHGTTFTILLPEHKGS